MKQSHVFLTGEGAAWGARNKDKLPPDDDPVMEAILAAKIKPTLALEIGCGNGWRLEAIEKRFDICTYGIDPACSGSRKRRVNGTAEELPPEWTGVFDLVIFGFCLYLVDREDLFRVVMEADRVLQDGGHLVIQDFLVDGSYARIYEHYPDIFSYKMNYAALWLGNPAYKLMAFHDCGEHGVAVLHKDIQAAWPILT